MKIGVDGGGSKTELILIDAAGEVLGRHTAAGCNPSVAGPEAARATLVTALQALMAGRNPEGVRHTALYMAGNRRFWTETASALEAEGHFGRVKAFDDSLPVLELATGGQPGLVAHAGTGSFVAALTPDGKPHYAGGLGWRFGDPGSGYDIGRRAIARALLELQGWAPIGRLAALIQDYSGCRSADEVTRYFYLHAESNRQIANLAPAVLRLVAEGDKTCHDLVLASTGELIDFAVSVARQLFPEFALSGLRAGLSGPILTHATLVAALAARSPLPFIPITAAPIEGVRQLLLRDPEG